MEQANCIKENYCIDDTCTIVYIQKEMVVLVL